MAVFFFLLFFFSFPLGVTSSFCAVALLLPLAFAELLLAAGISFPDGVVPVAGGVLEGPVGVFADAPPLALDDAAGLEALPEADPPELCAYAMLAPPSRSIAAAATRPVFLTVIIFLLLGRVFGGPLFDGPPASPLNVPPRDEVAPRLGAGSLLWCSRFFAAAAIFAVSTRVWGGGHDGAARALPPLPHCDFIPASSTRDRVLSLAKNRRRTPNAGTPAILY